jgi:tetratricopeptide (TPR) repeat protein
MRSEPDQLLEQTWLEGVQLLDEGDLAGSANAFERSVELDPTAADAWLGLHASSARKDEALAAMLRYRSSFGSLRRRLSRRLVSRYDIGEFVSMPLEDTHQLRLAGIARLLDSNWCDAAEGRLQETRLVDDSSRFLSARLAVLKGDWRSVEGLVERQDDPWLHEEAQLYLGKALVNLESYEAALNVLKQYPANLPHGGPAEAAFALWKGFALEGMGNSQAAARQFALAWRLDPDDELIRQKGSSLPESSITDESPRSESGRSGVAGGLATKMRAALDELDAMVGLEEVKQQVRKLQAQFRMEILRAQGEGRHNVAPTHLVFAGPPGTGKTTVARIVGDLLAGLGVLESGHLVETQRGDLVGKYLGHTAAITNMKVDEALDGVLFIDEAYALANDTQGGTDSYGAEAIQTLVKRAEDDRHRLVIILAGYPQEMERLLQRNPGIRSRFNTRIDFPAYSATELAKIASSIFSSGRSKLTAEALHELENVFLKTVAAGAVDRLGNARFARSLCHEASATRDMRLAEEYPHETPPTDLLQRIERVDIETAFKFLTASERGL